MAQSSLLAPTFCKTWLAVLIFDGLSSALPIAMFKSSLIIKIHHLGSLSHKRLDQMIFRGPFHPGLFCDSVLWFLYQTSCMSLLFTVNSRDCIWSGWIDVFTKTKWPEPNLEGANFRMLWLVWSLGSVEPCAFKLSGSLAIFHKFYFKAVLENIDFSVSYPPAIFLILPIEHILSPHHSQEILYTCTTGKNWREGSSMMKFGKVPWILKACETMSYFILLSSLWIWLHWQHWASVAVIETRA